MDAEVFKTLKHNFTVNILDGAFFGLALGFASFVTILPLFVSTLTSSATIIGLVPAFHNVGWQLPQLLTANTVARQKRFKPMVLRNTLHERAPFLGLAVIALLIPRIGTQAALVLTFVMLAWQGLGGGFTANPWQNMIAKIIPANRRGTFFGLQSSASNMLASLSAIAAGFILEKVDNPLDFAICFFLAAVIMVISLVFLAMAKEPERRLPDLPPVQIPVWSRMTEILRRDENFRKFLIARVLSQIAMMGFAFYTVYAVRIHGVSESEIGIMTGILLGSQILANPLMGWIGDRWSNLFVMKIGIIAATLSALLAWWAPSPAYFFLVFILTGIANVSMWTIGIAIVLEFGSEAEQPVYIGMSNTLVTPATILAPFLGGWLADLSGYPSAFLASALAGMAALGVYMLFVKDPRQKNQALQQNLAFQYNLAGTPDPIDKRESEHEQDLENTQN